LNLSTFNRAIFAGWLLISSGGMIVHIGYGMILSGFLLLALTFFTAHIGGIFTKKDGD